MRDSLKRSKERLSLHRKYILLISLSYNDRAYIVDDIDFTKTPLSTFELTNKKEGTTKEITFKEYFETVHKKNITDMEQPLLVNENRRTKEKIFLIPELSNLTGLTDQMRANFGLMKEMGGITHGTPQKKI